MCLNVTTIGSFVSVVARNAEPKWDYIESNDPKIGTLLILISLHIICMYLQHFYPSHPSNSQIICFGKLHRLNDISLAMYI